MKGFRTLIWNAANAVVPVLELVNASYRMPDEWMPYWLAAFILGNVVLRWKTTTPVGTK